MVAENLSTALRGDPRFTAELINLAARYIASPDNIDIPVGPTGLQHDALMLAGAVIRVENGWPVFPLNGKVPAIRGGRGVLDATTDTAQIYAWWVGPYRGANIGGRVPESVFVLDADPRKDGHREAARVLADEYGPFTPTLTTVSGRLDGGSHRFYWHPGATLSTARLGAGFDIKTHSGYVVLPPSVHPDTGNRYISVEMPIAHPDPWLVGLMRVEPKPLRPSNIRPTGPRSPLSRFFSISVADDYNDNTSWAEVLEPHGWTLGKRSISGDADGDMWLHPGATSSCSATVRHDRLFVYTPNTPFEITEAGNPEGYSRFKAFAVLNYGGDMSAAARALRQLNRGH
jgi:hypothetical protein